MSDVIGGLMSIICLPLRKTWGSRIKDFRVMHYRNIPGEGMYVPMILEKKHEGEPASPVLSELLVSVRGYGVPTVFVCASGGWVAEVVMIMSCTYFPRISPDPTTGVARRRMPGSYDLCISKLALVIPTGDAR
jgi:hypothetical protein